MKQIKAIGGILVLMLVGAGVVGAAAEGEWKKVGELNGITGYTRPNPKTPVDEVKAVGMIDAPVAVVEAVIRDTPAKPEFMYHCKQAGPVTAADLKSTPDVLYTYNVTHMPAPVKDRYVVARTEYTLDKATGTLYSHAVSINRDYPLPGNPVRAPLVNLDYTITPKGPDKCEFTYQGCADPGGHLPSWLVNMLAKNIGIRTIAGIREMVKKDKYRMAKGIVTVTPR